MQAPLVPTKKAKKKETRLARLPSEGHPYHVRDRTIAQTAESLLNPKAKKVKTQSQSQSQDNLLLQSGGASSSSPVRPPVPGHQSPAPLAPLSVEERRNACQAILNELFANEHIGVFLDPVDIQQHPNYLAFIR